MGQRRRLLATLAATGVLAPLGLAPAFGTDLVSTTAELSSARAGGLSLASNTTDYNLAIWNHDMQMGAEGGTPTFWSTSTPNQSGSARLRTGQAPLAAVTAEGEADRVLLVQDNSTRSGVSARGKAMNASPGRLYAFKAYMATRSGKPATLCMEFLDARGRRVGLSSQQYPARATKSMQVVNVSGYAPARTTTVRPLIYSYYAATGSSQWSLLYGLERIPNTTYDPKVSRGSVLFTGDYRVESVTGMEQVLFSGTKYGATATTGAKPVYDAMSTSAHGPRHSAQLYGTVIHQNGLYKMWFTAKVAGVPWSVRYATSKDGITWGTSREVLNDVWAGGVVVNPNPSNPRHKYLMLGTKGTLNPKVSPSSDVSYQTYSSPDGVTWAPLGTGPSLPFRDVAQVSYDPVNRTFLASTKQASGSTRQQFMSMSKDFVRWTTPRRALRADGYDAPGAQVYAGGGFRYGDQLLATPVIYQPGVVNGVNGPMQPFLASSHDSLRFSRPTNRTPLIPLGEAGQLDDGMILPASEPIVVGNTVRLYYTGWTAGHEDPVRSSRIFYTEWKLDRFAALRTEGVGEMVTKPLATSAGNLSVNFAPRQGGELRAELLDAATGQPLPGFGLAESSVVAGDTTGTAVKWAGRSLGAAGTAGRQFRIRFQVTSGDLYAFKVA